MPSGEQPQDIYDTYFDSVEHCISQLSNKGPLLVLGDLNAHLGCRGTSSTNFRGNKWIKMIDEHSLINVSLCSLASGPTYTYTSGGNSTTIDYIISNSDLDAFRGISNCSTLEEHSLNTSTICLSLACWTSPISEPLPWLSFLGVISIGQQLWKMVKFCCTQMPLMMLWGPYCQRIIHQSMI